MQNPISRFSIFLVFMAAAAVTAAAPPDDASAALRGPVLGYVLDSSTGQVRPINGIPGASHLGEPLGLPLTVTAFTYSSRLDFALIGSSSGTYLVRTFGTGSRVLEPIEGAIDAPSRLVLNADGSGAAIYSDERAVLQHLRGLPDHPAVGPPLDVSFLGGKIMTLALDRSGVRLLMAVADATRSGIYLLDTSADPRAKPRLIAALTSPRAIALLHEDRDAVVADAALNQLFLIRDFAGSADAFLLAGERDGISNPVGLQVSADGSNLFIANDGTRSLDVWNLAAQSVVSRLALDAAPSKLDRLQGLSTFLLNEIGSDPLLILDTSEEPSVFFVPAGREQ